MKKLKILIGKSKDHFGAYAENIDGIYGAGDTVEETKKSIQNAIKLYKQYNKKNLPAILQGDFEIVYRFDAESLFNAYKGILTNTGMEKLTGINGKQINHYATGAKKPRPAQLKKIEAALHKLGSELLAVEL
jgi:predicted RNase H-like HicB family nuclease